MGVPGGMFTKNRSDFSCVIVHEGRGLKKDTRSHTLEGDRVGKEGRNPRSDSGYQQVEAAGRCMLLNPESGKPDTPADASSPSSQPAVNWLPVVCVVVFSCAVPTLLSRNGLSQLVISFRQSIHPDELDKKGRKAGSSPRPDQSWRIIYAFATRIWYVSPLTADC